MKKSNKTKPKKWEQPTLTVLSTIETKESVLVTQSGGPFGTGPDNGSDVPSS
ncbi:MAG: hypothetical protein L3J69_15880 [Desulfobacula sp.]|nr:hypothetical protein [Desulfobacula sp.]